MTTEELLKPRYKVIANYPNTVLLMNDIIELRYSVQLPQSKEYVNIGFAGVRVWHEEELKRYPHLFKKLEWWEERSADELPKYIKVKDTGHYTNENDKKWKQSGEVVETKNEIDSLYFYLPATLEEFNSQSK